MNFKEYQKLALSTARFLATPLEDFQHGATGVVTEIAEIIDVHKRTAYYDTELNITNLKEEIGDVLWYLALIEHSMLQSNRLDTKVSFINENITIEQILTRLVTGAADLYYYSHFNEKNYMVNAEVVMDSIYTLFEFLKEYARRIGTDIESEMKNNIEKLAKRYPEGFTNYHAVNRDTENELSHFNNTV